MIKTREPGTGTGSTSVTFDGRYVDVRVRGNERRERALTLWKSVADAIRTWLAVRGEAPTPQQFLNAWGKHMTRADFECVSGPQRLRRAGRTGSGAGCLAACTRSLSTPSISGWTSARYRSTCAMSTLVSTTMRARSPRWRG